MSPWKTKKKDRPIDAALRANRNEPQIVSRNEIIGVIRKAVSDIMTQQMSDFEQKLTILANANTEKLGDQIQCFQTSICRHIENLEANIKKLQMHDDRLEKLITAQQDISLQETAQRDQEDFEQVMHSFETITTLGLPSRTVNSVLYPYQHAHVDQVSNMGPIQSPYGSHLLPIEMLAEVLPRLYRPTTCSSFSALFSCT